MIRTRSTGLLGRIKDTFVSLMLNQCRNPFRNDKRLSGFINGFLAGVPIKGQVRYSTFVSAENASFTVQLYFNDIDARVMFSVNYGMVHMDRLFIGIPYRGKGYARLILKSAVDSADKNNIMLTATASPDDKSFHHQWRDCFIAAGFRCDWELLSRLTSEPPQVLIDSNTFCDVLLYRPGVV